MYNYDMERNTEVHLGFDVDVKFENLEEFQNNFQEAARSNYVQYYIAASRTVEAAKKKVKRYLNPSLKWYSINWCCIHGGREFKPRGKGERKSMYFILKDRINRPLRK